MRVARTPLSEGPRAPRRDSRHLGRRGRTVYSQGALTKDNPGRDHHGRSFTLWMAGGGIRPGITYSETDDYCYRIGRDPVHLHDFNATVFRCLEFRGRDYRLTDVHGEVIQGPLA